MIENDFIRIKFREICNAILRWEEFYGRRKEESYD